MFDHTMIATMTRARTREEEDLQFHSIKELVRLDLPVVIGDRNSRPAFLMRLNDLPNVTARSVDRPETATLLTQIQTALQMAMERKPNRIFYTEPDKQRFFRYRLAQTLATMENHDPLGVTIVARDEESFATFPEGQRLTESLMNQLCGETFGVAGDYQYGPFLLAPEIVPSILAIEENLGWGWRQYAWAIAHRMGLPVRLLRGDFPCPPEQCGEDDPAHRIYRMEQFAQGIHGLASGLKFPLDRL